MFGKIRCSSSSSLESLESQRFSSKLLKEDSLSIYEVTLVKLKLGSQIAKDLEFNDHDSPVSSLTSVDHSMKTETSNSVTTSQEDSPDIAMMSIDTDSDSPLKPLNYCKRGQRPGSIAYMFSKFKSVHQQASDSSSCSRSNSMETGISSSPSFEHYQSESIHNAQKLAPALYVFGDSTVDPGNNNNFVKYATSNFPPYGVDFPAGPSGRPTNGYNCADYFATWLGLKLAPGFRVADMKDYNAICDGINFASSASGVLPETAVDVFQGIMPLDEQVNNFKKVVQETLPSHFPAPNSLTIHLSKSIFLVVIGTNDYGFTYLNKINSTNPSLYLSSAAQLLQKLGDRLTDLYNSGARKFVVFEIGALGCQPSYLKKFKPDASGCVDFVNNVVSQYNKMLPGKLQQLGASLSGSKFTVAKFYAHALNVVQRPASFGFKDVANPCCPISTYGPCETNKPACPDRDAHVYFDSFHMTQASYKILSQACFDGTGCVPFNVKQLAML